MFVNTLIHFLSSKRTAFLLSVGLFVLIVFGLFYVYSRGFLIDDEGWILSPAQRILDGQLPYRDFHFIYTPGLIYIMALGFKLFGVSFIVSRIITLVFSLASIFIYVKIAQKISKNSFAYLIPVLLFVVWGPMHINFAWPVIYAIWGGVLTLLLLLISNRSPKLIFLAGVMTGATILFKQNFGAVLLLNNIIFFYFDKQARRKDLIFYHILGIGFFPALMVIYFALTNTLIPFISDMYYFMFQQLILKGNQNTPFIYPGVWYKQIVKTIFYLSPLLISLVAVWFAFKKNKKLVFLASFTGLYYVIGIRPTTDYVHLVPLLAVIGVPLLMIIVLTKNLYVKLASYGIVILFFLLGLYTALFSNYYRWYTPLVHQNVYTQNPRLGILTDQKTHIMLSEVDNYIQKYPTTNKYLFVDDFLPSFYVVTNKKNPTKYIFFSGPIFTNLVQEQIIQGIKTKNTPLILIDRNIFKEKSLLSKYIASHYHVGKRVGTYWILVK